MLTVLGTVPATVIVKMGQLQKPDINLVSPNSFCLYI